MNESRLPLGIMKQACMKLDSALNDINEVLEDQEVSDKDKEDFITIKEYIGNIMAVIMNKVLREMDEDEFLNENINMDNLNDEYEEVDSLLDNAI